MGLDDWLAIERRRWSGLVQLDDGLPDHFEDLCRRTAPCVRKRMPFKPRWEADSAFTPSSGTEIYGLKGPLVAEWIAYEDRWKTFLAANPRCRLAWYLGWISETHDYASWPAGREAAIEEWVRGGFTGERPFDDRIGIDTPEWRRGLAETAAAAGDGWVYEEDARLVWRSEMKNPPA